MTKRVLITGGAGFIGSNLAAHYLEKGWEVVVYDNLSRQNSDKNLAWLVSLDKPNLAVVTGDVRDYEALCEAASDAEVIYHLAAQVAVTGSVEDPRQDFMINALGTFNVLEAARQPPLSPILIYASTNKVYGGLEDVALVNVARRYAYRDYDRGVSEEFPLDFHSPYACSKGAAGQYTLDYARIYGLKTVVLRQSCIYGPHQFGVEDQGWVAHFVISAMLGRPITIYGDGRQVRDVLHVRDLIEVFDRAVERIRVCSGRAYNVGGGPEKAISLLEMISRLETMLGRAIPLRFDDWRPGDQRVYVSDIRRARHDLGWEPRITIADGLQDLCDWVEANKELLQ